MKDRPRDDFSFKYIHTPCKLKHKGVCDLFQINVKVEQKGNKTNYKRDKLSAQNLKCHPVEMHVETIQF